MPTITLQQFAEKYCDGLYDSRFEDDAQCSGWQCLKSLVLKGDNPSDLELRSFHPNLRVKIKELWSEIKTLPCQP